MGERRKSSDTRESGGEQEIRSREVLRARRELAAYFRGQRTEREARAALKTIKAFVRDRQRLSKKSRPFLPGIERPTPPSAVASRKEAKTARLASKSGRSRKRAASEIGAPSILAKPKEGPSTPP